MPTSIQARMQRSQDPLLRAVCWLQPPVPITSKLTRTDPAMAGANLTMVEQALNSRGVALLMGLTLRPQLSSSFDTWNSASLPVNSRRGPSPQSLVTSARTAAIAMSLSQAMGSLALPIHDTNVLADVGMQIQDIARLHGSVWALNLPGDVRGSWFRSFRDRLAVALAVDHNMTHQSAGQLAVLTVQALMKELKHCSEHGTGCVVCGQYRFSAAGPATTFRSATATSMHRLCLEEARHDRPADSWRR